MYLTYYDFALVYGLFLCLLLRHGLSVPVTASSHVRNLATNSLSLQPFVSSHDLILPLNLTSHLQDDGEMYRVPNTYVFLKNLVFCSHQISSSEKCFES